MGTTPGGVGYCRIKVEFIRFFWKKNGADCAKYKLEETKIPFGIFVDFMREPGLLRG